MFARKLKLVAIYNRPPVAARGNVKSERPQVNGGSLAESERARAV